MADFNWKKIINFIAYVALIFVAIALIFARFIPKIAVLKDIATMIAFIITGVYAFMYARSKRNPWIMIFFVISAILVVIFMFL